MFGGSDYRKAKSKEQRANHLSLVNCDSSVVIFESSCEDLSVQRITACDLKVTMANQKWQMENELCLRFTISNRDFKIY